MVAVDIYTTTQIPDQASLFMYSCVCAFLSGKMYLILLINNVKIHLKS